MTTRGTLTRRRRRPGSASPDDVAELSIWHSGQPTEKSAGSTLVIHGFSSSRWSSAPILSFSFLYFYSSPTRASSTCSRQGRIPGPWGGPVGGLRRAGRVLRGAWGSGASTPWTPPPIQRRAGLYIRPVSSSPLRRAPARAPSGPGRGLRAGMEGTEGGTGFGGIRSLNPTPLSKGRGPPRSARRFHPPRRAPTWASCGPVGTLPSRTGGLGRGSGFGGTCSPNPTPLTGRPLPCDRPVVGCPSGPSLGW